MSLISEENEEYPEARFKSARRDIDKLIIRIRIGLSEVSDES